MLNIGKIIGKFVKNSNQKELDKLNLLVRKINDLEPEIKKISDESFPAKTLDKVLFPEPFGPIIAWTSPGPVFRLTPFRISLPSRVT